MRQCNILITCALSGQRTQSCMRHHTSPRSQASAQTSGQSRRTESCRLCSHVCLELDPLRSRSVWGKLTPLLAVKESTVHLWPASAPLLEEECNTVRLALVTNIQHPFLFHRSRSRATFAADDHPIDLRKVKLSYGTNQRLYRKKAYASRCFADMPYARCLGAILNGYDKPHMKRGAPRSVSFAQEVAHQ